MKRVRRVWGILEKIIRRESSYSKVVASFYRAVIHTGLLFGSDSSVMLTTINITVEGTHSNFLRKIIGQRERWRSDRM